MIVCYAAPDFSRSATFLAESLDVKSQLLTRDGVESLYYLLLDDNGLSLCQSGKKAPGPVRVDFASGKARHRMNYGGGKGQLLAKAVGINKRADLNVLDATAGLGQDSFVMATLGCRVTLLERSPVIFSLLQDGINRAMHSDADVAAVVSNMHLQSADGVNYLQQCEDTFDVIYLDPMYPHTDKTAKVKKEMASFRDIVGKDIDTAELLAAALTKATYRVVVKRPRLGDKIAGIEPSLKLQGKSSRYDIYTLKGLA